MITGLLNILVNVAMNDCLERACTHSIQNLTIWLDTLHYVRRPII